MLPAESADRPPKLQMPPPDAPCRLVTYQVATRLRVFTLVATIRPWYGSLSQMPASATYRIPRDSVSALQLCSCFGSFVTVHLCLVLPVARLSSNALPLVTT